MTALVAAGTVVGSPPDCQARLWFATADRRVALIADGEANRLPPVPGDAVILLVDAWARDPLAVLADGSAWRCLASSRQKSWISERSLLAGGGTMAQLKEGEAKSESPESLVLAGVERGAQGAWRLWAVTNARQVIVTAENVSPRGVSTPVPGNEEILAVRLMGDMAAEALLADGSILQSGPRGWVRVADVFAKGDASVAKVRAIRSFAVGGGKDVAVGEVFETTPAEARRLIAAGRAERVEYAP